MDTLNYRRARFIYNAAREAAVAAEAPIVPELYDMREPAFREQFEQVIEKQMGPERSNNAAQLHQDWVEAYEKMGWVYGPVRDRDKKTHPDMVPYDQLGHLEKDKDAVFVALCEIARKWIHKEGADCDDQQGLEAIARTAQVVLATSSRRNKNGIWVWSKDVGHEEHQRALDALEAALEREKPPGQHAGEGEET